MDNGRYKAIATHRLFTHELNAMGVIKSKIFALHAYWLLNMNVVAFVFSSLGFAVYGQVDQSLLSTGVHAG